MLLMLTSMLLGVGLGAGTMILDGFGGRGPGWGWYYGLVGLVVIGLLLTTIRSHEIVTRRVAA